MVRYRLLFDSERVLIQLRLKFFGIQKLVNVLKLAIMKYKNQKECHSERSEESSPNTLSGFFTSFRMTFFNLFIYSNRINNSLLYFIFLFISFFNCKAQIVDLQDMSMYSSLGILDSRELFDDGLLRSAEQNLFKTIKKFPGGTATDKANILQAEIDFADKKYHFAESGLTSFIESGDNSPVRPHAALLRAFVLLEQKNYKSAEYYFRQSQKIAEDEFKFRQDSVYITIAHNSIYWRALSIAQQGKYQDADTVFAECATKYPHGAYSDDALYALGLISEINRKFEEAAAFFSTIAKNYPLSNTFVAARIRLANIKLILREGASSISSLESAETAWQHIKIKDSLGLRYENQDYCTGAEEKLLYLRGEANNLLGNFETSLGYFNKFFAKFPKSALRNYARLAMGWAYLNKSDYENALKQYDIVIKETDNLNKYNLKPIAQLYRTVALKRNGETTQAKKELTALSLQPDYPLASYALLELSQLLYEGGELDLARRNLERAKGESTEANLNVRIHLLLGAVLFEEKSWEKAAFSYKSAEQIALASSEIYMPRRSLYISEARLKGGIALVQCLRSSEAMTSLQKFISQNKDDKRADEAAFWLAEAYYRSELFKNAIETYTAFLAQYPYSKRREEVWYGLGWTYFRLKDFRQSSATFDKMLAEFPKSEFAVEALIRKGDGSFLMKNYKVAVDAYTRAKNLSPTTDEGQYAAYQICEAQYRLGQYEYAFSSLMDFVGHYSQSPYSPYALYLIGWIRFQQHKYREAIDGFKYLISAYPQSGLTPRAHYAIGDAFYNQGNYEEAINAYKNVIQMFPSDPLAPEAMKSIQYCLVSLGREEEAIATVDTFITANPGSPFTTDFIFKKADMFYSGRKFSDAATEYEKFVLNNPEGERTPEALFWLGKSFAGMGDVEKAIMTYNNLRKKFPKSELVPTALLESALLKKQAGDISAADSIFRTLEIQFPENQYAAQAGFERALIKYSMGDTTEAIRIFRTVSDNFKGSEWSNQSRYMLAMYWRNTGKNDSALAHFNILAYQEDNPSLAAEALYRIGEIWVRSDSCNRAIESFAAVKEKFPIIEEEWYPLSLLNMGQCYEILGRIEEAKEIYRLLASLRPEDEYGKTAQRRLSRLK
ncbi:MAG: hypothetical protein HW421_3207 [Ignavibacteria bacterium]|nr:hypothetical protein [Ignavibacteria bacterium]